MKHVTAMNQLLLACGSRLLPNTMDRDGGFLKGRLTGQGSHERMLQPWLSLSALFGNNPSSHLFNANNALVRIKETQ